MRNPYNRKSQSSLLLYVILLVITLAIMFSLKRCQTVNYYNRSNASQSILGALPVG